MRLATRVWPLSSRTNETSSASVDVLSFMVSRSPRLPLELCHYIITFIHNDSSTLARCSLVCRAWLSATRACIFRSLVIESEGKYRRSLRTFVDHPHLARHVQELCIVGTMLVPHRAFGELFAVTPGLPQLKSLCLQHRAFLDDHVAPHYFPCWPRGRIPGFFVNVRELVLHVVFPRPLDFVQLLRACPNLCSLHLSVMLLFVGDHDLFSTIAVVPLPETVSLNTFTWRRSALFPLQWLCDHPKFSPRSMSLAWSEQSAIGSAPYREEMNAVTALVQETLRKTGPNLEHLELCADHGQEHELVDYGLSHCVCLRKIKLESSFRNRSPRARDLPWIVHAIRQLSSPVLSSIEIGLGWDTPLHPRFVAAMLADLDEALAHLAEHRAGLIISLLIWAWIDELVDDIIVGLPRLRATRTRFCVRMDEEGMRRARSEVDVTSHLSNVFDYQPGSSLYTTASLRILPLCDGREQVRWYLR